MKPGIVTLTTDFGLVGTYVAAMKGVILGLAPTTRIVDVSHLVPPQNIIAGAFVLSGLADAFPPGTVHLGVVDPGVGTSRKGIAVKINDQWFVGPDNGLLTGMLVGRAAGSIFELTNPALRRTTVSTTFHGRDIFAPAASHLVLGRSPAELGPPLSSFKTLSAFTSRPTAGGFTGEVLFTDSFGNLITNLHANRLPQFDARLCRLRIGAVEIQGLTQTYAERSVGDLVALVGSSGWVEIAVVNGSASERLGLGQGAEVALNLGTTEPS